jgi:hypothetical protein
MQDNLVFFIINITEAYESMNFEKAMDIYLDFLKFYV